MYFIFKKLSTNYDLNIVIASHLIMSIHHNYYLHCIQHF